ncbi:gamma-glutamylcyclotransferase family protein [Geodermatophilus sp. URMC 62]|uniref:gamma-glutamylcyclotransferase family protein n=1 Tax=Geodermatophilus sp. URMC 62 TaxID=3423414 RepID=UPI00406C00A1
MPLAILLSKLDLVQVVGVYVLLVLGWTLVVSTVLLVDDGGSSGFVDVVRRAFQAMWGPDSLFGEPGRSLLYYALALLNALVSVLLPVFVLGAFVFKLFSHDPLRWRQRPTLEVHPPGYFVLAVRFYNRLTVDLADVRVRAWLKWTPQDSPTVHRNKQLDLVRGEHGTEHVWPIAGEGEPTTFRVVLGPTDRPGVPVSAETIEVQGHLVRRDTARLLVIVEGVMTSTNEQFRSRWVYPLRAADGKRPSDIDEEGIFQDIGPDVGPDSGWGNFHGVQDVYVFVYGSLMRDADLRAAGLDPGDARTATLQGWRRRWNVASDPAHKHRRYRHLTPGRPVFTGRIVSLGLEREDGASVRGVVVRVGPRQLADFDLREQDYDRTDVSAAVSWPDRDERRPPRVFTYVPKPAAVADFRRRRGTGELVIEQSYFDSVRDAAARIQGTADGFAGVAELDGASVEPLDREDGVAPPVPPQ